MTQVVPGKSNGKRGKGKWYGYVCRHRICSDCARDVYKVWVGNSAGWRYSELMIEQAVKQHDCKQEG